ncbi:MAG: DivIVA domain-containing protein [Candidatus Krumholzibacteriota bacterium]|nr:DivIVA domain-containing protein [Candidatus Krumholzibacteriota bacterium]
MRITPLDIRKQEFRKTMRGLDSDEVYAFLTTVADEYEAVLSDNKKLRERIVELEERLREFKEIEKNLRNTLLTAERITAEAKENARREAGLILREAEVEADKSSESIRAHTQQLRREILELKKHKDNYVTRLRTLLNSHQRVIDGFEDDFATVDKEIDAIGKMVEEDTKSPAAGARMNRDRITEDFAHEPKDKVTWGEEKKREDMPRPVVPKPDQQAETGSSAAGPAHEQEVERARQSDPGMEMGSSGAIADANKEATKVEFHSIDADHVPVAKEDDPEIMSDYEISRVRSEVAHTIEDSLYPEAHIREYSEEGQSAEQHPSGTRQQDQHQQAPSQPAGQTQQPASHARVEEQVQTAGNETVNAPVMTEDSPEPQASQTRPGEAVQQDNWKSYEVESGKEDWSNYEVPVDEKPRSAASAAPQRSGNEAEVENALSGLTEAGGPTAPRAGVEPEVIIRSEHISAAPKPPAPQAAQETQQKAQKKDEEPAGEDTVSTWSMEELRKNLSNISNDQE